MCINSRNDNDGERGREGERERETGGGGEDREKRIPPGEQNGTAATSHCHKEVSVHFRDKSERLVTSYDFASDFA